MKWILENQKYEGNLILRYVKVLIKYVLQLINPLLNIYMLTRVLQMLQRQLY